MLQLSRPPISPVYAQDEPNGVIRLGNHQIEFTINNERYQREARVEMRFVPDDRLSFTISDEGFSLPFDLIQQRGIALSLSGSGQAFEGFCIASTSSSAHGGAVSVPRTSVITVTCPSKDVSTAVFHLLNFPDFLGREDYVLVIGEPPQQASKRCGQVVLKAGGWVITLAATDDTDERVRKLKAEGGYFITHVGRI